MSPTLPPGFGERRVLMDAARLERTLARLAAEIAERVPDLGSVVLVGVRTRGVPLARRLAAHLKRATGVEPPVGAVDITLYRDDLTTLAAQPIIRGTEFPQPLDGRSVVLVDDVLYTGRTTRAALQELVDFGRPARIHLAVLIDRGHRELPIHADHVGETVTTARDEIVEVRLREQDGEDRVVLLGPEARTRPERADVAIEPGVEQKAPPRPAAKRVPKRPRRVARPAATARRPPTRAGRQPKKGRA